MLCACGAVCAEATKAVERLLGSCSILEIYTRTPTLILFSVRMCMCINDWDARSSAAGTAEPRRTEAEVESTWETWRSCGPGRELPGEQVEASGWGRSTVLANTEERSHIAVVERDSLTSVLDTVGTVHTVASG